MPGAADRGLVLAFDLGTSGLKTGLVAPTGEVAAWTYRPLRTEHGPDGAATQDAHEWWRLAVQSARECLGASGVDGRFVTVVCVTGQFASTVPVDVEGVPVGPCVMWMDSRGAPYSRAVVAGHVEGYRPGALTAWVRRTAGIPSAAGADPLGHMLFLDNAAPEVARAARWYLEPVDYLTMRFTGEAAATPASMTAAWLTDNRRPQRLAYDPVLLARAGLDGTKLPPLVETGTVLGQVTEEVADLLGIPAESVVVAGIPDPHSAAVGAGCVLEGQGYLSIGTTAWVSCPMPSKRTDLFHQMATFPGLTPDSYLLGDNQETAGRCLAWFRDTCTLPQDGDPPSYDALVALAATSPPGAGGVIFTPWLAGERSPVDDHAARGGFHNVGLGTTTADLTRAVLEGVAFNIRWLLEGADRFAGRRLTPLRIVGGGAQSLLWCQIVADVCNRPVERVAEPLLTGLRGAGLFAGRALGAVGWDDIPALVPVDARLEPAPPVQREVYDRLFAEFPGLYRLQKRMFHRLNRPRTVDRSG